MGKIRTKIIGLEEVEEKQKTKTKVRREQKRKREQTDVKEEEEKVKTKTDVKPKKETKESKSKLKAKKQRGKNYQTARKLVDKNKSYPLDKAIVLLKKIHYADFDETVELHLNVKSHPLKGEVKLPHAGFGKKRRIAIVDETVIAEIDKGKIVWDVLIATSSMMPKLVKYARLLGPKGLMPNPKNGTLTDKPDEAVKKFTSDNIQFKTEAQFPLIHQAVGKLSFTENQLKENILASIKAVSSSKIDSLFLKSTMSPSLKLDLSSVS